MPPTIDLTDVPTKARITAVELVGSVGLGYLGQVLSSAELMTATLGDLVRPYTDRFILSPAHYVTAVYAVGAELGLLDRKELIHYGIDGAALETIGSERTPLVDFTCGSLAQGLSVGIGYALADRLAGTGARTAVFASDGEMEEGQTWEAALFAAHHRLDTITVVLDCNNSQVDGAVSMVTTVEPVSAKWEAFGWEAVEVDGHDLEAVLGALHVDRGGKPLIIVGRSDPTAGLNAIAGLDDAHFITLGPDLVNELIVELKGRL